MGDALLTGMVSGRLGLLVGAWNCTEISLRDRNLGFNICCKTETKYCKRVVLFFYFLFIYLFLFFFFLLLLFLSVQLDLFIDFYYICFFSNSLFCSYIINNADHLLSFAVVIYQL